MSPATGWPSCSGETSSLPIPTAPCRRTSPPAAAATRTGRDRYGPRSYRLDVAPDAIDAVRFAGHPARAALEPGPSRRLAELDAALALRRGRPFTELDHPDVQPEVACLAGLRAVTLEHRAEALLAAGCTGEAIAAAEA